MSKVYFLIRTDSTGNEVSDKNFSDLTDLTDYMTQYNLIKLVETNGMILPTFASGVRVKIVDLGLTQVAKQAVRATPKTLTRAVDDPDFWVEVPSESVAKLKYSVGIRSGNIISCSCPDFRERRKKIGDACKHMWTVYTHQIQYNLLFQHHVGRITDAPVEV